MYLAYEICHFIPIDKLEHLLKELEEAASPLNLEFLLSRWPQSNQNFHLLY